MTNKTSMAVESYLKDGSLYSTSAKKICKAICEKFKEMEEALEIAEVYLGNNHCPNCNCPGRERKTRTTCECNCHDIHRALSFDPLADEKS